jgi:hypothetical protein
MTPEQGIMNTLSNPTTVQVMRGKGSREVTTELDGHHHTVPTENGGPTTL